MNICNEILKSHNYSGKNSKTTSCWYKSNEYQINVTAKRLNGSLPWKLIFSTSDHLCGFSPLVASGQSEGTPLQMVFAGGDSL